MTLSKILPATVLAAALLGSAAAPASAIAISHTNRAAGDPDAAPVSKLRGTPPADTSGPSRFDRLHQDSNGR